MGKPLIDLSVALRILDAFEEYLAWTHNDGEPVSPPDGALDRALEAVTLYREMLGGVSAYPGYPA